MRRDTAVSFTIPRLRRREKSNYQPTYRESDYRRSIFFRLTPLARFIVGLLAVGVLAGVILLINQAVAANNGNTLLSDRLNQHIVITPTPFQARVVILFTPEPTPVPEPTPTEGPPTPTPEPTVMTQAPWASQLTAQPDGTLMAPQQFVAKAMADLGAYYAMQNNLSLDDFIAKRDWMLTTYFTGAALEDMRRLEQVRDIYAMNRSGQYSIEIRNFAPDGMTAKAGVITRGWVSDVYDLTTMQLVAQGREKKDTLTIMAIVFEPASGRWKFAAVEEVIELNQ